MAGSVTFNVRLDQDALDEVDRWAVTEQRTRSQMIRVLLGEALAERRRVDRARSTVYSEGVPATPAPDPADGLARAKARALSPDTQQRLRESRAATASRASMSPDAPFPVHPFRPSAGNSLKCECGVRIKDHG